MTIRFIYYIKFVLLGLCLSAISSCDRGDSKVLERAANIVDERPDSAYVLLKQVDLHSFTSEEDRALYALTHAKAKMYMGHSLVTDTVIPVAVEFFNAKGDTAAYVESIIAQAYHLRSMELRDEAF